MLSCAHHRNGVNPRPATGTEQPLTHPRACSCPQVSLLLQTCHCTPLAGKSSSGSVTGREPWRKATLSRHLRNHQPCVSAAGTTTPRMLGESWTTAPGFRGTQESGYGEGTTHCVQRCAAVARGSHRVPGVKDGGSTGFQTAPSSGHAVEGTRRRAGEQLPGARKTPHRE